jgi:uncharacterized protein (TIGR03435 family)
MKTAIAVLLLAFLSSAQSTPSFEVASLKPTDPSYSGRTIRAPRDGNTLIIRGLSPGELIRLAFGPGGGVSMPPDLMIGGPKWIEDGRYDLDAKASGVTNQQDRLEMLKTLMVERCRLAFHYEVRQTSVYVLTVGKGGVKMKARSPGDGGEPFTIRDKGDLHFLCRDTSINTLAQFLSSQVLNRPVLERTGLPGNFDFELAWNPDETQFGGAIHRRPDSALPDLVTAIRGLGLRLESAKAPVQHLVIDHLEKPSAN